MLFAAAHPETNARADPPGGRGPRANDEDWPWGENDRRGVRAGRSATLPERLGVRARHRRHRTERRGPGMGCVPVATDRGPMPRAPGSSRGVHAHGVRHRRSATSRRRSTCPDADPARERGPVCHVENARFLAATIPEARRTSSSPERDHVPWFEPDDRARRDSRVPHRAARGRHAGSGARDRALHRSRRLDRARRRARRPPLARPHRAASRVGAPRARALRRPRGRHGRRRLLRDVRRTGSRDPLRAGDRRRGAAARTGGARRAAHRRGRARRRQGRRHRREHRRPRRGAGGGRRGARLGDGEGPRRRLGARVRRPRQRVAQGRARRVAALRVVG